MPQENQKSNKTPGLSRHTSYLMGRAHEICWPHYGHIKFRWRMPIGKITVTDVSHTFCFDVITLGQLAAAVWIEKIYLFDIL